MTPSRSRRSNTAGFCGVVDTGSGLLIAFSENPVLLLTVAAVIAAVAGWVLRRTDWSIVDPLPIVARRRAGQLIRGAGRLYRTHVGRFVAAGLVLVPVALVVGGIVWLVSRVPLIGALLDGEGELGPIGAFVALSIGLIGYGLGLVAVRAAVAASMRELEGGGDASAGGVYRVVAAHLGSLLVAMIRAGVIIALLSVSVIGIPWAIRQLVGWQLFPDAIVLEGRSARSGLDRSNELVRGRWWNTAGVVVLLGVVMLAVWTVGGLLLLIVTDGLPLWLFSMLLSILAAVVAPFAAAAVTLLYGDARAGEAPLVEDSPEPSTASTS